MKKKYQIEMMSLLAGPAMIWDVGKILDVPGQCSHEEAEQLIECKYAKIYIDPMTQKAQDKKNQQAADDSAKKATNEMEAKKQKLGEEIKDLDGELESRKQHHADGLAEQETQEADLIERQEALEAAKAEVKKQETSEAPAASESAEAPKAAPKKASDPPAPPPKK